ncbi:MAG: Stp1/IreP family PP2C-type Ser/Thr phosphatase [Comamonadaceae bacterium]|nr:Stp1/IreP family PP2C-type Ser/Thr phosphatase [Comamonadaceae bacterium]
MNYTFFGLTDRGLVRTNNEDSVAFDATANVAVLADGMGGYSAGEVASNMATTAILADLVRWLSTGVQQANDANVSRAIESSAKQANLAILKAATTNLHYAGMGTTLVVGVFLASSLVLAHVGDSRCYLWRDGVLSQITKDHSMLQEQVDAGLMTPEQAAVAPGKNLVTRALGVEEFLRVEIHKHMVMDGDIYLMCSDGLTDMLDLPNMSGIMACATTLESMATLLVDRAKDRGGRDNISVLLTQAVHEVPTSGLISRLFGSH